MNPKNPIDTLGSDTFEELQRKVHDQLSNKLTQEDIVRIDMLSSLETYTRVMFREQYGHSFIVNPHHVKMFEALQDVIDGKCTRLIINMPPRYSKTEIAVKNFTSFGFALNPRAKFLHLSYSDTLVTDNSQTVQECMKLPLYKRLFPDSVLKKENNVSSTKWRTKAGGEFYAVPTQGQVTGFGAGNLEDLDEAEENKTFHNELDELLGFIGATDRVFQGAVIIDDPIKPDDAQNETLRNKVNLRFESTIRNRVNSRNTPIVIIMQRLHEDDLCGHLMRLEPEKWRVLSLPAISYDADGTEHALWPIKHTLQDLHDLRNNDSYVFDTQYMQDPTPHDNLMYAEGFQTYKPEELIGIQQIERKRWNYTDIADTGSDKYCSICFINTPDTVYVTDILFTGEPTEVTEPLVTQMLTRNKVVRALMESNNGGRQHAKSVKKRLRDTGNYRCMVTSFHQGDNKYSRIFNCAAGVTNDIKFPDGWEIRWPQFASEIKGFRRDCNSKTTHDDAPDALTGVYEMHCNKRFTHHGISKRN